MAFAHRCGEVYGSMKAPPGSPIVTERSDDSPISSRPSPWWIQSLHLTEDDKQRLSTGRWLNDKLIDTVNRIVADHVQGDVPQSSLVVQVPGGFDRVVSGFQIIYDNVHWVAVCCQNDKVMFANSMTDNISPFVAQQLKQLYAGLVTSGGLAVHVVPCSRQTNGSDCGVFAAAFLFQWALLGDTNLDIKFDVPAMRTHRITTTPVCQPCLVGISQS